MRKLLTLLFILVSLSVSAQNTIRMSSEKTGFFSITNDTLIITKSDKVVTVAIYAPTSATDSVKVSGCNMTVGGITSSYVKIPPGEAALNLGFKFAVMDTVKIWSSDKFWIVLLKDSD